MAHESIAFIEALDLGQVDLLGFSIGSFAAQQIALTNPIVRRVILASAAPQGAADMHGWAAAVIGAIGAPQTSPEEYLDIFFARSPTSREAGKPAPVAFGPPLASPLLCIPERPPMYISAGHRRASTTHR